VQVWLGLGVLLVNLAVYAVVARRLMLDAGKGIDKFEIR
jgi:hypothetical protein